MQRWIMSSVGSKSGATATFWTSRTGIGRRWGIYAKLLKWFEHYFNSFSFYIHIPALSKRNNQVTGAGRPDNLMHTLKCNVNCNSWESKKRFILQFYICWCCKFNERTSGKLKLKLVGQALNRPSHNCRMANFTSVICACKCMGVCVWSLGFFRFFN
jgi:hypothetical protein